MKRVLCMLLLSPGLSWAATYKCAAADGTVVYSGTPCSDHAQVLQFKDDQAISQGKLEVRLDAGHSYRTAGTVNGHPISFIVDTGASRTSISAQVAQAAGVQGCAVTGFASTANGVVRTCAVTVPEITFGGFHVKNLVVSIMPNMGPEALLGMDVLGRMTIQQQDGVMYISSK